MSETQVHRGLITNNRKQADASSHNGFHMQIVDPLGATTKNSEGNKTMFTESLCRNFFGSTDSTSVEELVETLDKVRFPSGHSICREGERGDCMYFIIAGRVRVSKQQDGDEILLQHLGRGDHFGELSLLTNEQRTADVTAVTDTLALRVDHNRFHAMTMTVPEFTKTISKTLARRLRANQTPAPPRTSDKIVGILHATPDTFDAAQEIADALSAAGESLHVFTDDRLEWPQNFVTEKLPIVGSKSRRANYQRIANVLPKVSRVVVSRDIAQEVASPGVLDQCENILWLVTPQYAEQSTKALERLLRRQPSLRNKIQLVWVMNHFERFAPPTPSSPSWNLQGSFKLQRASNGTIQGIGVGRIVNFLRKTRVGIALGGGGALGLAHLGVLRGLESAGIHVDLMSGTSIGSLMGLIYGSGRRPTEAAEILVRELRPNWFFRQLPHGEAWNLLWKYRTNGWNTMLRRHFSDITLDQLQIPLSTVAVDLIQGQQVIRDNSDAVNAVLESINLPGISRPIMRDSMALIDGGILNNVPVDLLRPRGADVVLGVNVIANLSNQFGQGKRRLSPRATINRVVEVQRFTVRSADPDPDDVMLDIDTSNFEFHDFMKAHELAEVGEAAVQSVIPTLQARIKALSGNSGSRS